MSVYGEVREEKNVLGVFVEGHAADTICCNSISTCMEFLETGLREFSNDSTVEVAVNGSAAVKRIIVRFGPETPDREKYAMTALLESALKTLDGISFAYPRLLKKQEV